MNAVQQKLMEIRARNAALQNNGTTTTQPMNPVRAKLLEIRARNAAQAGQPVSQPTGALAPVMIQKPKEGLLKGLAKSIVKPFAETATAGYNALSATGNLLSGDVEGANKALEAKRDLPFMGETKPGFTGKEGFGEGVKKMAGYGAEMAATVAPVGRVGLGAKSLLIGSGKIGLQSVLGSAGNQLAQNGNIDTGEVAKSAMFGALLPVGLRGAGKLVKGFGGVAAAGLGKTTGAGVEAIKETFKNPNVIKFAREAGRDGGALSLQRQALEDSQAGLQSIIEKRGKEYRAELEKITTGKLPIDKQKMSEIINKARTKAVELMDSYGINTVVDDAGKPIDIGFDGSTITQNKEIVKKALKDVIFWQDNTPAGLDVLKKRLSQFKNDIPASETGGARNFIQQLQDTVKNGLNKNVPGYEKMTKKYAQASDLIDDIRDTLSLNDGARQETAVKKLQSAFRDNNDLRKEFVDMLTKESGQDIMGKIAGAQMSPTMSKGLSGAILPGSIAAGVGMLRPETVPLVATYIAASSPRLMAELTSILGIVTQEMIKANKFSEPIRNRLVVLLSKTLNKKNSD